MSALPERSPAELAASVEKGLAALSTNGTIVCSYCNASDVTDDDHRASCAIWPIRQALSELERLAERQRDALAKIEHGTAEPWARGIARTALSAGGR